MTYTIKFVNFTLAAWQL